MAISGQIWPNEHFRYNLKSLNFGDLARHFGYRIE